MTLPVLAASLQLPPDFFIPQAAVDIAQGFFTMVAAIALGVPIIRAVSRRWERGSSAMASLPPDLTHRLERSEQAVEAVAIEVERMAEAQRFTAKLMAERQSLPPGELAAGSARAPAPEVVRRPDAAR
jgi:hypothetical protein